MMRTRTIGQLESDLIALRAAADRAGTALACLFSSSDEFEAAVIRVRRAQGAYRPQRHRQVLWSVALTGMFALAFLMM